MHLCVFKGMLFHNHNRGSKTKHISGLIDSPNFVRTLQVHDICTVGDAANINSEI